MPVISFLLRIGPGNTLVDKEMQHISSPAILQDRYQAGMSKSVSALPMWWISQPAGRRAKDSTV